MENVSTPPVNSLLSPELPNLEFQTKNKKIFIWSGLVIVLIALIGLAAGFFYFNKNQHQASLPVASPDIAELVASPTPVSVPQVDTTNWTIYQDNRVGFSFKYPPELVTVNNSTDEGLSLSVTTEKLADIPEDLPSFMGRKDALEEKSRLAQGLGERIFKIDSLNGDISTTYSMFEVCSVMFVKKLTFYPNDYRVMLTLNGPEKKIIAAMPDSFKQDPANCGENLIWNQDKKSNFETVLLNHQGQGLAQTWYDTFYAIANTVQLTVPITSPVPTVSPAVSPTPISGQVYKNDLYGFTLTYDKPYRLLTDKDSLSAYPHGLALFYTGGQAYNLVIEVWDSQSAYEKEYAGRISDLKIFKKNDKYITILTILNNTDSDSNQKIIDSLQLLP
jgi:hypothetical protein